MKKIILFTILMFFLSIYSFIPRCCLAAYMLFDDKLRVKGSLYEFMIYRTDIPRQERQYRDTEWGLMRSKATLELLYKAVENDDLIINWFGFFQYWHDSVPDFDEEYHDSITAKNRKRYQGPFYDEDDWINELYIDMYAGKWNIRLGKQIVFWSEVEMVRTIDRINQLDLRYTTPGIDPWDEMKLGLWMMRGFYNSDLPGQLVFEWIWVLGDFEQVRTPTEGTSMSDYPKPEGPEDKRPRPFGQKEAVDLGFYRARPAFNLRNSSWAFRIRGNSEVKLLKDYYLLDWTVSWFHGMNNTPVARNRTLGEPSTLNMDTKTLNGYLNANAVSRVFGRSLPHQTHDSLWKYKFFDAVGVSCQTYVPAIGSIVRGEISYEIGLPINKAFPLHIDPTPGGNKPIIGTTERDQLNIGLTFDKPILWKWLSQRWGASGVFDCTVGWFGQWRLGNVTRWRSTYGYQDRSQTNFTATMRTRLRHNELWPTIRFLYNTRNWGYGAFAVRYTPGKHMRYELGFLWFYAIDPSDAKEAFAENKDAIYFRVGYEF